MNKRAIGFSTKLVPVEKGRYSTASLKVLKGRHWLRGAGIILNATDGDLSAILDNIPHMVFSVDKQLNILKANKVFIQTVFRITGIEVKPGDDFFSREADLAFVREWKTYLFRALGGHQFKVETSMVSGGKVYRSEANFTPIRKDGNVAGVACFSRNISENSLNVEQITYTEPDWEPGGTSELQGVVLLDAEGKIKYASDSVSWIFGYKKEDVAGRDPIVFIHPNEREALCKLIGNLISRAGESMHWTGRIKTNSGDWCLVRTQMTNLLEVSGIHSITINFEDITEKKNSEEKIINMNMQIREVAGRQSSILDSLDAHIVLLNEQGSIMEVNESWRKFADENGLRHHNYGIGLNYIEISERATGKEKTFGWMTAQGIRNVLEGKEKVFIMEYPCDSPDVRRWFKVVVNPLIRHNKKGVVVHHLNITDRKLAELQIDADRRNRDALINNTSDMMWSIDKELKLISANQAYVGLVKSMVGREARPGDSVMLPEFGEEMVKIWKERYEKVLNGESFTLTDFTDIPVIRYTEITFNPIFEAGEVLGAVCYARDVTEKKEAEDRILRSERMMAEAEGIAHFGSWELDLTSLDDVQQNELFWSDEVFRIFGYEPGEIEVSNAKFFEAVHPDDREMVKRIFQEALEKRQTYSLDHRIQKKDGSVSWVHEEGKIIYDKKNSVPIKILGTVLDITERKEAEEKIRQAELNYREIFDKASDVIFVHDLHTGKIIDVNQKVTEVTGFTKEEILNGNPEQLMAGTPGHTLKDAFSHLQKTAITGHEIFEWHVRKRDGELLWTEVNLVRAKIAGCDRILAFFRAIDDRKQAEEALIKSEERYRQIVETAQEGIWMIDENGITTYVNQKICEILEYRQSEMLGRHCLDFVDEASIQDAVESMEKRKSGTKENTDRRYRTKSGRLVWANLSLSPLYDKDGNYNGCLGMVTDITSRKLMEESLSLSNERYQLATRATNDAIWDWNIETDELYLSDVYEYIFGYKKEDGVTLTINDWEKCIYPDDRQRVLDSVDKALQNPDSRAWECEYRYLRADGSIAYVYDRGYTIRGENGKPIRMTGAMQDITQRKQTEEDLRKKTYDINERVKELNCLYRVSMILNNTCISIEEMLGKCVEILPSAYQFPEITCARITFHNQVFETGSFVETRWKQLSMIYSQDQKVGSIEVFYKEQKPEEYEGPFLKEEMALIHSIARNITLSIEQKRAEESLQKSEANLRTIFDHTDHSFVLLDASFNLLSFNSVANELAAMAFDCNLKEGKPLFSLLDAGHEEMASEVFAYVLEGNILELEIDHPMRDGAVKWFECRLAPVKNDKGGCFGICLTAKDITDQKTNELEREKMTSEIIQRNKDLEQFAYIVSHNLRAPVANIIGYTDLIDQCELNEEESKEIFKGLRVMAGRLDDVIIDLNSILQEKRKTSEKRELVSFTQVVESIQASIDQQIEKEGGSIRYDFTEVDEVLIFKSYLYSIFYNLISNSLKYRQPHLPPVIEIKSHKLDNLIRLTFQDNGMGIDLKKAGNQFFGLYKRFHPQAAEGKGMGLFMVKMQVEALGGKIDVESEVNEGTRFTIEFKL